MDRPPSSFLDLNEDQPQEDHLFNLNNDQISPTLTLSSYPPQDQGEFFYRSQPQRYQLQSPLISNNKADHKIVSCDLNHPRAEESESENNNDLKLSITWKKSDHVVKEATHTHNKYMDDSVKWTSSKMRMMRKMIITNNHHPDHHHHHHHHTITNDIDHHHHHDAPVHFTHHHHKLDHHHHQIILKNINNNNNNNKHNPKSPVRADHHSPSSSSNNIINNNLTIRVCSDCNTTKTPLWRSGPRGPKSLCNACGIRQRKARRAMAAAAAAANGTIFTVDTNSMKNTSSKIQHNKEKKSKLGANSANNPQFKNKRSNNNNNNKLLSSSSSSSLPSSKGKKNKLLCFEDLRISINKNSAFQRVFPQDEKDAAILLMALSYGLVHG